MKFCLIAVVFFLAAEPIWGSPARRIQQFGVEKYLDKAKAVLDRVPLIDGYSLYNNKHF